MYLLALLLTSAVYSTLHPLSRTLAYETLGLHATSALLAEAALRDHLL